jgi:DNA repair exonuclease SbcCD ATPase subunit
MAEVLEKKILDLLDRREELVGRLNNLENMKPDTNARVYRKIREDYSTKLQSVLEKINEQRGSLETKAKELASQIEQREKIFTQQSDQVDELQIRAKLGEFNHDNDDFKNELNQAEGDRDKTSSELDKLRKELSDLNGVLSDVDHATSAGVPGMDDSITARSDTGGGEVLDIDEAELLEEETVAQVEDLDMDLEDVSEDSEDNKCPKCGHVNPPHLVVCEECNAELEDLSQDLDDEFDFDDMDVDI